MNRHLIRLVAALLGPTTTLACNAPRISNAIGLDPASFDQLAARLASRDSVHVQGSFGQIILKRPTLTADSLVSVAEISGRGGARIALHDVTVIKTRGSAASTGALVGAGVGLAGGVAASMALSSSLCSDGGCDNETGGTMIVTLGSTVIGALLGALVGTTFKKWHTDYHARQSP